MNPKRRLRHTVMLIIGYVLVGIALLLLTTILVFVAYGFGLKDGRVIQSGLVFFSSAPNPAHVYIDGARYNSDTNTKATLPEGAYHIALKRSGYRDWNRVITVVGGQVESFSYPFLFPDSLTTNTVRNYAAVPALATESTDQRWLLVARPASYTSFDLYDLNNPKKAPEVLSFPADILATSTNPQTLELVAWASDNTHLLVRHAYDGKTEYALLNRTQPEQSVNLTRTLALPATTSGVRFINDRYDQYYIWDSAAHDVSRIALNSPTLKPYVKDALAFASNGDQLVLYATPDPTDPKKVSMNLFDGINTYVIRRDAVDANYILAMASYGGDLYVAMSAPNENVAYVYKNPIDQLSNEQLGVAVPVQVLHLKAPNYAAFSDNGQYVAFENGTALSTYDVENDMNYDYVLPDKLDAPQAHIAWMDSARLAYVTNGQVLAMDYDGQNRQALVSADPRYTLFFGQSYKTMYTLVPAADKSHELLTSTSLRIPADQ